MSTHSRRLRNGVRELIRIDGITLEDLHIVATDVVATLDKLAARTLRKLKRGQEIRCYNEDSKKEYGQRGSDYRCFFDETHETKTRGVILKVYDAKQIWSIGIDCLLEVFDSFDPESEEGKKRAKKAKTKRKGRRTKEQTALDAFDLQAPVSVGPEYEPEELGEEYNFDTSENWEDYYGEE